jgi:triphosphatase
MSPEAPLETRAQPNETPDKPASAEPLPAEPNQSTAASGAPVLTLGNSEPAPARPDVTLEFSIGPEDAARLFRLSLLAGLRQGKVRVAATHLVWHDSAGGELAQRGLALVEQRGLWRLERLMPDESGDWPPATVAPVLAQARDSDALGHGVSGPLMPVAAFQGRQRSVSLAEDGGPVTLDVIEGTLRAVADERSLSRLRLTGEPRAATALALRLSEQVALDVPRAGLPAEALAVARGNPPPPRHLGAPHVPSGLPVEEALARVTSHLADVVLHWGRLVPEAETPEPVHQMRVGTRRLRSALAVFRRAAAGPTLSEISPALRDLAHALGAARDWDVFIAGTGEEVRAAFPDDKRVEALLAAAGRKRTAAYQTLRAMLASPAYRHLALTLALLPTQRPWLTEASAEQAEILATPVKDYAARRLRRELKKLRVHGEDISGLPAPELHEIRKQGKKLRYIAEFFAPLFPQKAVRRFLERMEKMQEAFGVLNDGRVAAQLMAQLNGGTDRAFAAGIVQGYVAACSRDVMKDIDRTWEKFLRQEPFWED